MQVTITINGEAVSRDVEPRTLLVHFIRDTPGLTGTHWGCDTSNCGACVVLMDGKPVKSCTTLAAMCEGHEIRTVESLEVDGRARPGPAGLPRAARAALRVLHPGDADDEPRAAGREPRPDRARDPHRDLRRDLPVHGLQEHRRRGPLGRRARGRDATGGVSMATVENLPSATQERPIGFGRLKRKEDARFIRGKGTYLDDIRLPGMVHGGDPAQPVRAREDHLDRHVAGARAPERRGGRSRPRTSRRSASRGCRRSPTTPRPCWRATRSASRARRSRSSSRPTSTRRATRCSSSTSTTTRCPRSSTRARRSTPTRR